MRALATGGLRASQSRQMNPHDLPMIRAQGGAFTAQQAREWCRWEELRDWQRAGVVVRQSHSVLHLADAPADVPSRIARAELSVGQPLIACWSTAAQLHGFDVMGDGSLHVTTVRGRSVRAPQGVTVHQMALRTAPMPVSGCFATCPADTAVDVAASVREIDVLAVLDAALRVRVPLGEMTEAVERAARMRGIVEVRRQLPWASPHAESAMESRSRFRIHQAGLPAPELQIVVPMSDGTYRRLDMGWRRHRVGVEFDGQDFHSGDGSLDRDRQRARELIAAGWTIVNITAGDVYRSPERFSGLLQSLLNRKSS
jgi:hypothetical protein